MKRIFPIVICLSVLWKLGLAQQLDKAKLDSFFLALETNNKFMGSVSLSKNGKNIYARSVGFSDIENSTRAKKDTKYRIGSISKTFTATLVLKAFEQKKIQLQQTIADYLPTIQNADKITIADLLRHRSGIRNFTDDDDYLTWNTQPQEEKDMIAKISAIGSDFEPGSKAKYSNSNYVLLTYILEKTYNKPYAEILSENITEPIGLSDTYLGVKINPEDDEAKSYRFIGHWKLQPETHFSVAMGAGSLVSTPEDVIAFGEALFAGKIITSENVNLMRTILDGHGMGIFEFPFYDKRLYGHTGAIDGFSAMWGYLAKDDISIALTSNGANTDINNITIVLLTAVYGGTFEIPQFSDYQTTEEELEQYRGIYSSEQMPLKITFSIENKTLIAQATGQQSFTLEATEKNKFSFDQADLTIQFYPETDSMMLEQRGKKYIYTKEALK